MVETVSETQPFVDRLVSLAIECPHPIDIPLPSPDGTSIGPIALIIDGPPEVSLPFIILSIPFLTYRIVR
jgi:hypothetical protein